MRSKEDCFAKELKLAYKWANIFGEREDSNNEEDDEPVQITKTHSRGRLKKG